LATYIVTFDLKKSGGNYAGLWSAIRGYTSSAQISPSSYGIETNDSAGAVFDNLEKYLERYDFLYVIELGKGLAGRGSDKANSWLQEHMEAV